ncbi:MAG: hypothetical protein RLZZ444_2203 [Pseudomonadota bacterium]|jgi:hypothetical protein
MVDGCPQKRLGMLVRSNLKLACATGPILLAGCGGETITTKKGQDYRVEKVDLEPDFKLPKVPDMEMLGNDLTRFAIKACDLEGEESDSVPDRCDIYASIAEDSVLAGYVIVKLRNGKMMVDSKAACWVAGPVYSDWQTPTLSKDARKLDAIIPYAAYRRGPSDVALSGPDRRENPWKDNVSVMSDYANGQWNIVIEGDRMRLTADKWNYCRPAHIDEVMQRVVSVSRTDVDFGKEQLPPEPASKPTQDAEQARGQTAAVTTESKKNTCNGSWVGTAQFHIEGKSANVQLTIGGGTVFEDIIAPNPANAYLNRKTIAGIDQQSDASDIATLTYTNTVGYPLTTALSCKGESAWSSPTDANDHVSLSLTRPRQN